MRRIDTVLSLLLLPGIAAAEAPLSAIDWLKAPPPVTVAEPLVRPLGEPARGARVPDVVVVPLDSARPDAVGLLPSSTTGLPRELWSASSGAILSGQLSRLGGRPLPAVQALYYTLLLAEADPPDQTGPGASFLRARIGALRRFGAVEAALALIERAGPATPELFGDWLDLALLTGNETAACQALARRPDLSSDYASRIFCTARSGDWATAALTFDAGRTLGVLGPQEEELLERFLAPELAGDIADLPPPREMTPLLFRLYEANGTPLPTGSLPREYAVADLRGTMGWKAEIEAAERLARTGALPANRLLGLYSERAPAASGGVWDRVRAIQNMDRAIAARDFDRIAAALPEAWRLMRESGLEVAFAALYGDRLARLDLPDDAARLAHQTALLAPGPARVVPPAPDQSRGMAFLDTLARGAPDPALADTPTETAIAIAFAARDPAPAHAGPLAEGRLGQTILMAAAELHDARPGQTSRIEAALATLRAAGLREVARQAALQILLLRTRP